MTAPKKLKDKHSIDDLLSIMTALRNPETGCDWDIAQSHETIVPYTIEEAYEVAGAVEQGDMSSLKDELGDLLFQVVFQSRIAEENGDFDFPDVVTAISSKMLRRHPHVFGTEQERKQGMVPGQWEEIKAAERRQKEEEQQASGESSPPSGGGAGNSGGTNGTGSLPESILADIPMALPALSRAIKLQGRAARVGFDWPGLEPVFDKMREELGELEEEISAGNDRQAVAAEFGDLLFVMANVARHLGIDPEESLRMTNRKFVSRFTRIEELLAEDGRSPGQSGLEEMDRLWDRAKAEEK